MCVVCKYVGMHVCMDVCMCIDICMCACMCVVCMYEWIGVCVPGMALRGPRPVFSFGSRGSRFTARSESSLGRTEGCPPTAADQP